MEIRKILFPTDFSDNALEALSYATDLADKYKARLYVMHVIYEPAEYTGFYVPHISFDKIKTEIEAGATKMMNELIEKHLKGRERPETIIIMGNPADEIVRYADDKGMDLIVMGTQGKKGIEKFVFGSTAEKVVKKSKCNVYCVKPK